MSYDLHSAFPSQENDEAVFVFARPFWLAFVPTLLIFLLVFALASIGQVYISGLPAGISGLTANIAILGLGIFQLAALIIFLVAVLDFYFDLIIVTDRRLADVDQEQLFYRKISELNLKDVEDTSFVTAGFFQTYFNYGSITVQTAGETTNFIINNLRYPAEIARIIADLADQAKDDKPEETRFPEHRVIGVIEGDLIVSALELVARGAMNATDPRASIPPHA